MASNRYNVALAKIVIFVAVSSFDNSRINYLTAFAKTWNFTVPKSARRIISAAQADQFRSSEINACEIREDFRRRSNTLHYPLIYRSVKLLRRTAAYPAVPYDLTQNDEFNRVLL